ncbi:MAG: chromosome segregation protein SMC [Oscillospiraceae bacterium]|nr:chromosome segregation protein SMC [Oscillospiraceae bacterium]
MYLKSLELHGFKSFPDRTKLDFGGGLTAVVGPNGSGKSNISDAVRWVLGEQSTKTLRGNRMEDVIFGGTQLRHAMGYAQVQLIIDNSQREMPLDADQVVISRKLYRSGESEYRINGNNVRLKDIYELFMDTGLGRDGYSIIGQGRISEIVGAKSTQRREIFEEAAGISKYRYRKTEAERRLEQAGENLLRLKDIMGELEERIGPLKAQSQKAKEYVVLAGEKKELEVSLWLYDLERIREQLRGEEDKLALARSNGESVGQELEEIEKGLEALFAEIQQASAGMDALRRAISVREEEIAGAENAAAVENNNIFHNEKSIERLQGEIEEQKNAGEDTGALIEEKNAEIARLAQQRAKLEEEMQQAALGDGEQQRQLEGLQLETERVRRESAELAMAQSELKVASITARNAQEDIRGRMELMESSREERSRQLEQAKKEKEDCAGLLQGIGERLQALENTVRGLELKQASREQKREELSREISAGEGKIREKEQRASLLLDMEKSMEGFAQSVRFVLSQGRSGAVKGIHGAVSKLIEVESRYTTAVEVALGGALQNIVVDNEDVARRCINLLKEAKSGRATFLPLSSVRGSRLTVQGLDAYSGFVGLAADLVKCDSRYSAVVDSLLGRIAVVEDLDEGIRMAKAYGYKFRIVTLDGQQFNTGGSMTGGFIGKASGLLSRQNEVDRLRREAGEMEKALAPQREKLRQMGTELSAMEAQLSGARGEIQTCHEDQIRYEAEQRRLELMTADLSRGQEDARRERENLEQKLTEQETLAREAGEKLEAAAAALTEKEMGLEALRQKAEALRAAREETAGRRSELQMQAMTLQKDEELLRQAVAEQQNRQADSRERMEALEGEIQTLQEQNRAIAREIEAIGQKKEALRKEADSCRARIEELSGQQREAEKQSTGLRAREKEVIVRKEQITADIDRLAEKQAALQKNYDDVVAKLWDEYELTRSEAEAVAKPLEDPARAGRRLGEVRGRIRALGTVNLEAIEEYEQVSQRYEFMSAQIGDVEKSRDQLTRLIRELTVEMRQRFSENFIKINENFSHIFVELFGGGKAELRLTDAEDVLEAGIEIYVQPPGKIIKHLAALSGGEQAFVAIAIYFAILKVRPSPFCLLDEIEAALDDVNVAKFAAYLQKLNDKTQFIAITHRRGTMEEADVLYGVTMQEEGVSKLLELEVSELESKLGLKE